MAELSCPVCGGTEFRRNPVLWPELIQDWQLSPAEVSYIDTQQGKYCTKCGSNVRSMALARALQNALATTTLLAQLVESAAWSGLRLLEINEAGTIAPWLAKLPGHVRADYPGIDIHALPYPDASFDIVTHSDTLEHVRNPLHALTECRRVLKPGGFLCFTIPIIIGRLTRGRDGLKPSYHGFPDNAAEDYRVQTEYGADAWTSLAEAGFADVKLVWLDYPSGLAMIASNPGP
jgi:SAM-dependent methyltransferase